MTGKDAIKTLLESTSFLATHLISDLSDADLQVHPVPGANNIAWQMGHLIAAETQLGAMLNIEYPKLPTELAGLEKTATNTTRGDGGKLTRMDYVAWFDKIRKTTLAGLAKLSDADLDKPNDGPMKQMAPTMGAIFVLVGNHTMMHAGQFSVVRRALKKPVLI